MKSDHFVFIETAAR